MTLTLKINNDQHLNVLLDFEGNAGRVSLKQAFMLPKNVAPKDFCFVHWDMKQKIQPITVQQNT